MSSGYHAGAMSTPPGRGPPHSSGAGGRGASTFFPSASKTTPKDKLASSSISPRPPSQGTGHTGGLGSNKKVKPLVLMDDDGLLPELHPESYAHRKAQTYASNIGTFDKALLYNGTTMASFEGGGSETARSTIRGASSGGGSPSAPQPPAGGFNIGRKRGSISGASNFAQTARNAPGTRGGDDSASDFTASRVGRRGSLGKGALTSESSFGGIVGDGGGASGGGMDSLLRGANPATITKVAQFVKDSPAASWAKIAELIDGHKKTVQHLQSLAPVLSTLQARDEALQADQFYRAGATALGGDGASPSPQRKATAGGGGGPLHNLTQLPTQSKVAEWERNSLVTVSLMDHLFGLLIHFVPNVRGQVDQIRNALLRSLFVEGEGFAQATELPSMDAMHKCNTLTALHRSADHFQMRLWCVDAIRRKIAKEKESALAQQKDSNEAIGRVVTVLKANMSNWRSECLRAHFRAWRRVRYERMEDEFSAKEIVRLRGEVEMLRSSRTVAEEKARILRSDASNASLEHDERAKGLTRELEGLKDEISNLKSDNQTLLDQIKGMKEGESSSPLAKLRQELHQNLVKLRESQVKNKELQEHMHTLTEDLAVAQRQKNDAVGSVSEHNLLCQKLESKMTDRIRTHKGALRSIGKLLDDGDGSVAVATWLTKTAASSMDQHSLQYGLRQGLGRTDSMNVVGEDSWMGSADGGSNNSKTGNNGSSSGSSMITLKPIQTFTEGALALLDSEAAVLHLLCPKGIQTSQLVEIILSSDVTQKAQLVATAAKEYLSVGFDGRLNPTGTNRIGAIEWIDAGALEASNAYAHRLLGFHLMQHWMLCLAFSEDDSELSEVNLGPDWEAADSPQNTTRKTSGEMTAGDLRKRLSTEISPAPKILATLEGSSGGSPTSLEGTTSAPLASFENNNASQKSSLDVPGSTLLTSNGSFFSPSKRVASEVVFKTCSQWEEAFRTGETLTNMWRKVSFSLALAGASMNGASELATDDLLSSYFESASPKAGSTHRKSGAFDAFIGSFDPARLALVQSGNMMSNTGSPLPVGTGGGAEHSRAPNMNQSKKPAEEKILTEEESTRGLLRLFVQGLQTSASNTKKAPLDTVHEIVDSLIRDSELYSSNLASIFRAYSNLSSSSVHPTLVLTANDFSKMLLDAGIVSQSSGNPVHRDTIRDILAQQTAARKQLIRESNTRIRSPSTTSLNIVSGSAPVVVAPTAVAGKRGSMSGSNLGPLGVAAGGASSTNPLGDQPDQIYSIFEIALEELVPMLVRLATTINAAGGGGTASATIETVVGMYHKLLATQLCGVESRVNWTDSNILKKQLKAADCKRVVDSLTKPLSIIFSSVLSSQDVGKVGGRATMSQQHWVQFVTDLKVMDEQSINFVAVNAIYLHAQSIEYNKPFLMCFSEFVRGVATLAWMKYPAPHVPLSLKLLKFYNAYIHPPYRKKLMFSMEAKSVDKATGLASGATPPETKLQPSSGTTTSKPSVSPATTGLQRDERRRGSVKRTGSTKEGGRRGSVKRTNSMGGASGSLMSKKPKSSTNASENTSLQGSTALAKEGGSSNNNSNNGSAMVPMMQELTLEGVEKSESLTVLNPLSAASVTAVVVSSSSEGDRIKQVDSDDEGVLTATPPSLPVDVPSASILTAAVATPDSSSSAGALIGKIDGDKLNDTARSSRASRQSSRQSSRASSRTAKIIDPSESPQHTEDSM